MPVLLCIKESGNKIGIYMCNVTLLAKRYLVNIVHIQAMRICQVNSVHDLATAHVYAYNRHYLQVIMYILTSKYPIFYMNKKCVKLCQY